MKKAIVIFIAVALMSLHSASFAANPGLYGEISPDHWVYDAIKQLDARGLLIGYESGAFSAGQLANRFEIAGLVAFALAQIDVGKADENDIGLINELAAEFKPELDALRARQGGISSQLRAMEGDIGGWRISGELQFDAKFSGSNDENPLHASKRLVGKNEFDMQYYRIVLNKRIDGRTTFTTRLDAGYATNDGPQAVSWNQYYVTVRFPNDIDFIAGRYSLNWENDLGFVRDNDPYYGNVTQNTLMLSKKWRIADLRVAACEFYHGEWSARYKYGVESDFLIAMNLDAQFNEKLSAGMLAYWLLEDSLSQPGGPSISRPGVWGADYDVDTYGVYAGYEFTPNVELKGLGYWQKQGTATAEIYSGFAPGAAGYDDLATAWKVVLNIGQDAAKIGSLWVEYARIDNNFLFFDYTHPYGSYGADVLHNQPGMERHWASDTGATEVMAFYIDRWWWANGLWHAFARYVSADFGMNGLDGANNWTVGLGYRFDSGLALELSFDKIDYGEGNPNGFLNGEDYVIQLRTYIAF
jgi:hypothetical protein